MSKKKATRRIRKPIKWPGGKGRVVGRLLLLMPYHKVYVEPFGGSAALLFNKPRSAIEVYNDIDGELVNLFRVIKDEDRFNEFRRRVELTLYSRAEQREAQEARGRGGKVDRAVNMYVAIMQGISGSGERGLGVGKTELRDGMNAATHAYLRCVAMLPEVYERLRGVTVEAGGYREVIERYDGGRTFFYIDPPYVMDKRKEGLEYKHEFSKREHEGLLATLRQVEGKVLISGYDNELYRELEGEGWDTLSWSSKLGAMTIKKGGKRPPRVETVWANYDLPRGVYDKGGD